MSNEKKGVTEADIQKELEGEPLNLSLDIQQEPDLVYFKLDEVDFDHQWNIRREDKYAERCERKAHELLTDGYVRQPLVVARIIGADGKLLPVKPRGTCGFLRHGSLGHIAKSNPEAYKDKFEGKVPYRVIICTEEDRQRVMMDHGSEELLDEYELILAVKKYLRLGKTEREIAVLLSPLFFQLADHKKKREFRTRIAEFKEKGHVGKAFSLDNVILEFWRRRVQNYKRIVSAPPAALEYFKKSVDGIPGHPRPSQEVIEKLRDCGNDVEVEKLLLGSRKVTPGEQKKGMGHAKIADARKIVQSKYLTLFYDVILGEKTQEELVTAEDELIQIEVAIAKNPDAFWKMIEKLLK